MRLEYYDCKEEYRVTTNQQAYDQKLSLNGKFLLAADSPKNRLVRLIQSLFE